jgi:hypothetical protein
VPLKHGRHTRVAPCRTVVLGCTETPLSSSRPTATFAPQLLLLTCRAISASPPPLGLRKLTVRGSSQLTASGHHLHTSSLWTSSPCIIILLPPVVRPALTSALPHRRSLHGRPCQGTAVRDLVALRMGLSRSATPHFRPRTPEPRAFLARIALLLTRLKPPCTSLLAPSRSPPLEFCSCTQTPTPPASVPCLFRPPNTCTHCQLLRITTRTLTPPAQRRPRSALAPLARARRTHTHPHRVRIVCRPCSAGPEPHQLPASSLTGSVHAARSGLSCSAALTPTAARPDASCARSASAFAAPPIIRGPRRLSPPVRRTWCLCHLCAYPNLAPRSSSRTAQQLPPAPLAWPPPCARLLPHAALPAAACPRARLARRSLRLRLPRTTQRLPSRRRSWAHPLGSRQPCCAPAPSACRSCPRAAPPAAPHATRAGPPLRALRIHAPTLHAPPARPRARSACSEPRLPRLGPLAWTALHLRARTAAAAARLLALRSAPRAPASPRRSHA